MLEDTHARTRAHTHTHTVQTDRIRSKGQSSLTEIFWEEKCLELAFERRESSRINTIKLKVSPVPNKTTVYVT